MTKRTVETVKPTKGQRDLEDHCDDCGEPISGGECWLGLCKGCESEMAEDPIRRQLMSRR